MTLKAVNTELAALVLLFDRLEERFQRLLCLRNKAIESAKKNISNDPIVVQLLEIVCQRCGMTAMEVLGRSRCAEACNARWIFARLLVTELGLSMSAAARVVRRDHAAVCYAFKHINTWEQYYPAGHAALEDCRKQLRDRLQ